MALDLAAIYPGQIGADVAYPYGKARNETGPEARDGFPFEERWLNDLFGFQQALLEEVGATPSGAPDEVGASQYLDAIKAMVLELLAEPLQVAQEALAIGQVASAGVVADTLFDDPSGGDPQCIASDPTGGGEGIVLVGVKDLAAISVSDDSGQTWTRVIQESTTAAFISIHVVPGAFAVAQLGEGGGIGGRTMHVAAYPYASWGAAVPNAFPEDCPVLSSVVTSLGGTARLVLVGGDDLMYFDAGSSPVAGPTAVDLSSVIQDLTGIATDGSRNVVSGDNGAGQGCIAHALIGAGGVAGDWTRVDLGSTASVSDVCWNGSRFIAIGDDGALFYSTDGVTWEAKGMVAGITSGAPRLLADPATGVVYLREGPFANYGDVNVDLHVSKNGDHFARVADAGLHSSVFRLALVPNEHAFISGLHRSL